MISQIFEPGLEEGCQRAGLELFGGFVDLEEIFALPEYDQELLGLPCRCFERIALEEDDRPRKNGKQEEYKKHHLHDSACG